jgi:glycosyltransferase involved in cell wall biosynthesis
MRDAIQISFAGAFGNGNRKLLKQLSLEDIVVVRGLLSHRDALQLQADSDLLFLPMESNADGRRSFNLSGKVFEYLAMGKPILAAVPQGDLSDLIQRAEAGWWVDPYDEHAMKSLLLELIRRKQAGDLGIHPKRDYIRQFERREATRQLAALFDSLLLPTLSGARE